MLRLNLTGNKIVKFIFGVFQRPLAHGPAFTVLGRPHGVTAVLNQRFPKYGLRSDGKILGGVRVDI